MIFRRRPTKATPRPADFCPPTGDSAGLIDAVSRHLGRKVSVVEMPLPVGLSGMWASLATGAEVIVLDQASTQLRRDIALCHEVAHIVLGHGEASSDKGPADLVSAALPDLSPELVRSVLRRQGCQGDPVQEEEAEHFATELFQLVQAARASVSLENRFS